MFAADIKISNLLPETELRTALARGGAMNEEQGGAAHSDAIAGGEASFLQVLQGLLTVGSAKPHEPQAEGVSLTNRPGESREVMELLSPGAASSQNEPALTSGLDQSPVTALIVHIGNAPEGGEEPFPLENSGASAALLPRDGHPEQEMGASAMLAQAREAANPGKPDPTVSAGLLVSNAQNLPISGQKLELILPESPLTPFVKGGVIKVSSPLLKEEAINGGLPLLKREEFKSSPSLKTEEKGGLTHLDFTKSSFSFQSAPGLPGLGQGEIIPSLLIGPLTGRGTVSPESSGLFSREAPTILNDDVAPVISREPPEMALPGIALNPAALPFGPELTGATPAPAGEREGLIPPRVGMNAAGQDGLAALDKGAPQGFPDPSAPAGEATHFYTEDTRVPAHEMLRPLVAAKLMEASADALAFTPQRVKILLHPPELGQMLVKLVVKNSRATVNILVESAEVRQLVISGVDALRNNLQTQGISVDQVNVALREDSSFRESSGFSSKLASSLDLFKAELVSSEATPAKAPEVSSPAVNSLRSGEKITPVLSGSDRRATLEAPVSSPDDGASEWNREAPLSGRPELLKPPLPSLDIKLTGTVPAAGEEGVIPGKSGMMALRQDRLLAANKGALPGFQDISGAVAGANPVYAANGQASAHEMLRPLVAAKLLEASADALAFTPQRVKILLHPPELGQMLVKLVVKNSRATVNILVESAEVRQLVISGVDALRNNLQTQGISVDQVNVALREDFLRGGYGQGQAGAGHEFSRGGQANGSQEENPVFPGLPSGAAKTVENLPGAISIYV